MKHRELYLGRDLKTNEKISITTRDLLTHAVVIGASGSGKTGLALTLLEEISRHRVPMLLVDPKGDLGNLALAWSEITSDKLLPYISEEQAERNGHTVSQEAEVMAKKLMAARAEWGITPTYVQQLHDAAEVKIYTPGSTAGLPINVLAALDHPDEINDLDLEALQDRVASTVSAILSLAGIEADPVLSPEHVYLSRLLSLHWLKGENVTLQRLIIELLEPPADLKMIGVYELNSYFKLKDRDRVAVALNSLIASPSFTLWTRGEPFEMNHLLRPTTEGKSQISIFYLNHLNEIQRNFFITLLATGVVGWMMKQPGTEELRAMLYIDEATGICPPVKEPLTKKPIMKLFKQARAFGVSVVLATQNPTDLDYKTLGCGVWLLGRLQTEQDRSRLIGSLSAASNSVDSNQAERMLASLETRQFLLYQPAKGVAPRQFQSRQAISYLKGPLTREDISRLKQHKVKESPVTGEPTLELENLSGYNINIVRAEQVAERVIELQFLRQKLRNLAQQSQSMAKCRSLSEGADYTSYRRQEVGGNVALAIVPETRLLYLQVTEVTARYFRVLDRVNRAIERLQDKLQD